MQPIPNTLEIKRMKGDIEDKIEKMFKDVTEKQFSLILVLFVAFHSLLCLVSVIFISIQSFLLTSSSLKHTLLITGVGLFLDFFLLRPLLCLAIALFKTLISRNYTREQIKRDMGMVKSSDLGRNFNRVISEFYLQYSFYAGQMKKEGSF